MLPAVRPHERPELLQADQARTQGALAFPRELSLRAASRGAEVCRCLPAFDAGAHTGIPQCAVS